LTSTPLLRRALCAAIVLAALSGCELMKRNEEVTTVVNRRAIGMPAGEFFDRFGRPGSRLEQLDGSTVYDWTSGVGYALPGPAGLDDRICRLKVSVDTKGRVGAVQILFDAPGQKSTSRCSEIFAAP
jgi:hypothetical protein